MTRKKVGQYLGGISIIFGVVFILFCFHRIMQLLIEAGVPVNTMGLITGFVFVSFAILSVVISGGEAHDL